MEWTSQQKQVIELKDRNILVSAAAGSGKTAVLVERIIQKITDEREPVDVDRLLVVTFTKAAASEMRERIGDALERELERDVENLHLQRQQSLLHNAQITTIDSFCLYIVRNYFHTIDLEPGFRIADEGELELLKEDVLDEVLEECYGEGDQDFLSFVEAYGTAKSDKNVRSMIWELYQNAQANPWPDEWLEKLDEDYRKACTDPGQMPWMQKAVSYYRDSMEGLLCELEKALRLTKDSDGPQMYASAIEDDIACVKRLAQEDTYEGIVLALSLIEGYAKLKPARNYEGSLRKQERVKAVREEMKGRIKEWKEKFFFQSEEELRESLRRQQPVIHTLIGLVKVFQAAYGRKKRKKNVVDFLDVEHFALEILVDKRSKEPTAAAEEFRRFFVEVMIDEYQDSNYLQEAVLTAVSREKSGEPNRFMVGDVKQSIYRFRLARPELFMEKYETYTKEDSPYQKIELHQNFRSRPQVLETVNDIFYKIMGRDLGRIAYDEDAALYPGAAYEEVLGQSHTEILMIETEGQKEERSILEARRIGMQIRSLCESAEVTDKKSGELRPAGYSDMVILLRSPGSDAEVMAAELGRMGIPAHTISRTGYFSTQEIQVLLNYLAVLDNPRQDIPLASVLSSWFGRLTKEELARVRILDKERTFYENVLYLMRQMEDEEPGEGGPDAELLCKLRRFTADYRKLRRMSRYLPIHELLYEIFSKTGYLDYVTALPGGIRRRANVEMLLEKAIAFESTSYRGLFHFIRYIEKLQKYDVDFGEAEIVSENEEAVRIMSIHKSKGLEFPICFVAGLGKQFNMADSRGRMVIHPDLGIGLEECDGRRRLKSVSFAKQVLAKQADLENLGEEMRVLYVALTRAKEKLILVGSCKKAREKLESYENQTAEDLLSYGCRSEASCFFDWILPAVLSYGEKYPVELAGDLETKEMEREIKSEFQKEELLEKIHRTGREEAEKMRERLSFVYPRAEEVSLKAKVSVSELKHRAMVFEEEEEVRWFQEETPVPYVPEFMKAREENRGALRGTAVHRAMECMDFASMEEQIGKPEGERKREEILPLVEKRLLELLEMHKIDEEMYGLIQAEKIAGFFTKEIARRMGEAQRRGQLFLEKPFVMGKEASEIYPEMESKERILIQGIVDVFFIEGGKVHVLDYKTDRVNKEEQLTDRYRTQIELYAEALARVFHVEAGEKLIYSFALEETIVL